MFAFRFDALVFLLLRVGGDLTLQLPKDCGHQLCEGLADRASERPLASRLGPPAVVAFGLLIGQIQTDRRGFAHGDPAT